MLRFVLTTFLMVLSSMAINAEDYTYLTFQTKDGTEYSIAVSGLSITFSDGYMVASDGTALPLSDLSKMYFNTTSDIENMKIDTAGGAVLVFNASGVQIGSYPTLSKALSALGKGLYMIRKDNGETNKIIVR